MKRENPFLVGLCVLGFLFALFWGGYSGYVAAIGANPRNWALTSIPWYIAIPLILLLVTPAVIHEIIREKNA